MVLSGDDIYISSLIKESISSHFEIIHFESIFVNGFYEAYFLGRNMLLMKDNSVKKKGLYLCTINGENVRKLDWDRKEETDKTYKYQFHEVFICPSKALMVIKGDKSMREKGKERSPVLVRSHVSVLSIPKIIKEYNQSIKGK